jgi:hypothetical protein
MLRHFLLACLTLVALVSAWQLRGATLPAPSHYVDDVASSTVETDAEVGLATHGCQIGYMDHQTLAVISWCLRPYGLLVLHSLAGVKEVTWTHTGCHHQIGCAFELQNKRARCQPYTEGGRFNSAAAAAATAAATAGVDADADTDAPQPVVRVAAAEAEDEPAEEREPPTPPLPAAAMGTTPAEDEGPSPTPPPSPRVAGAGEGGVPLPHENDEASSEGQPEVEKVGEVIDIDADSTPAGGDGGDATTRTTRSGDDEGSPAAWFEKSSLEAAAAAGAEAAVAGTEARDDAPPAAAEDGYTDAVLPDATKTNDDVRGDDVRAVPPSPPSLPPPLPLEAPSPPPSHDDHSSNSGGALHVESS